MILISSWYQQSTNVEEVPQRYFKMNVSCSEKLDPPRCRISRVSPADCHIVMAKELAEGSDGGSGQSPALQTCVVQHDSQGHL